MSISRTGLNAIVTLALAVLPMEASVAGGYRAGVGSAATFLDHSQLRDWVADGERGLWIQTLDLRWFYARFSHACHGLNATNSLSFDMRGSDRIDSRSAVVVPGSGRCAVRSFVHSQGPPKNRNADVVLQPQTQG